MNTAHAIPEWSLGDRMKKARTNAGLTRPEIRDRLLERGFSASVSTISAWETDTSRPQDLLGVIDAWSDLTGASQGWVLGVEGHLPPYFTPQLIQGQAGQLEMDFDRRGGADARGPHLTLV